VMDQLGFIPRGGESFEFGGYRFSVVEMDGRRVARVKIQRLRPAEKEPQSETSAVVESPKARAVKKEH